MIKNGEIQMVINTPGGMIPRHDENAIRAAAYANNVCIMTTITGAQRRDRRHPRDEGKSASTCARCRSTAAT